MSLVNRLYISCVASNGVKPLNLILNKMNQYTEEHNRNKHLILVHTDESKESLKKYEELWKKIKDLLRSINNNSDDYVAKFIKMLINLDDDLPLIKTLELHNIIIIARSVFHDDS